ncbi:protein phosphatase 2C domain-containing protein [Leuconostocaceae bacterium ESL0958]|nr:protein phosphatase 2C domain-containing protein [Leuconostocaceae bacterium ESL0958]
MVCAYQSNRGPKRPENQDAVGAFTNQVGVQLFLLADGVASQPGSKQASELVVARMGQAFIETSLQDPAALRQWADAAAKNANQALLLASQAETQQKKMATTLVLALLTSSGVLMVANAGDSRAYLLQATGMTLLTYDHTVKNERLRSAATRYLAPSAEDAALTRYLGVNRSVQLEWRTVTLALTEGLYLTSDGLGKVLTRQEQFQLLSQGVTDWGRLSQAALGERVAAILQTAIDLQVPDNITALLANRVPAVTTGKEDS